MDCCLEGVAFEVIRKDVGACPVPPNLVDYHRVRHEFSWDALRSELQGLPLGGLNMAHEAVDRHAAGPRADHVALRWLGKSGSVRDWSYRNLARESGRFANALHSLGVGRGDRVFSFLGRVPELYLAALGTLKNTSVFCPLFSQFGPEPVEQRLRRGDARVAGDDGGPVREAHRRAAEPPACRCGTFCWWTPMTTSASRSGPCPG